MVSVLRPVAAALLGAALAAPVAAQSTYFVEGFDAGLPPSWTRTNLNGSASFGWLPENGTLATPGVEHEDEPGYTSNDALDTPDVDLSAAVAAWLHFDSWVGFANTQANHPQSIGDGVSRIEVSTDGGLTWSSGFWVDGQTISQLEVDVDVDLAAYLGSATTRVRFEYFGTFAHNWVLDNVTVDDSATAPPPPPPPPPTAVTMTWMNLPTAFTPAPGQLLDGFEGLGGVIPPEYAVTELDAMFLPSTEGWANLGQRGPMQGTPFAGAVNLELGSRPNATLGLRTVNALVMGFDGGGTAAPSLDFQLLDYGDELDPEDGAWVSVDGSDWYLLDELDGLTQWQPVSIEDMSFAGFLDLTGQYYLMFAQTDDFPFGNFDGIAIDHVELNATSDDPVLTLLVGCGLPNGGVEITQATPNGPVSIDWARSPGTAFVPGGSCLGIPYGLNNPRNLVTGVADANGVFTYASPQGIPAIACGLVVLQGFDIDTCTPSNLLFL